MKTLIYTMIMAATVLLSASCKEDWTIKDVPPIPESAQGFGYVAGFDGGGSVLFAVEVPADGTYTIGVVGRGTTEGTAGTGEITANGTSVALNFANLGSWGEQTVTLPLKAGINDIEISGNGGNGLFHIDYIELK